MQFLVSEGQSTTTYAYDSFDQLVRENNQAAGKTWTYAYDDGGKRITKTVNGTAYNYHYLGDQLVELTWGSNKLHFTYDSTDPLSVNYNGTEYFNYSFCCRKDSRSYCGCSCERCDYSRCATSFKESGARGDKCGRQNV